MPLLSPHRLLRYKDYTCSALSPILRWCMAFVGSRSERGPKPHASLVSVSRSTIADINESFIPRIVEHFFLRHIKLKLFLYLLLEVRVRIFFWNGEVVLVELDDFFLFLYWRYFCFWDWNYLFHEILAEDCVKYGCVSSSGIEQSIKI